MGEAIDAIVPNRLTSPASHLTREGLVSRIRKGDRMVADVQDSLGSNRHAVAAIGLDESSGQNFVVFDPEPNNFRDVPVDDFLARVRLRTSHLVSSNDPI